MHVGINRCYDYHSARIPPRRGQLRQFFAGRRTLFRHPAFAEHADQVARRGAGRGAARPFQKARHPHRGGRGGFGAGPADPLGLQLYQGGCGRAQGRNGGQAAPGRHSDYRALPAPQVHPRVRARFSQGRAGDFRDGHGRHHRGAQARPHRRRAGRQRHLRRGHPGAGAVQRPFFRLRLARKSALRAAERPHRGHRPQGPGHPQSRQLHARPDHRAVPGAPRAARPLFVRVGVARHAHAHRRLHVVPDHHSRNGRRVYPRRPARPAEDAGQGGYFAQDCHRRAAHLCEEFHHPCPHRYHSRQRRPGEIAGRFIRKSFFTS